MVEAEQLELPAIEPSGEAQNGAAAMVADIFDSYELVRPRAEDAKPRAAPEPELSFSDIYDFELCPVRYRFRRVWGTPAPPDELLNRAARDSRSSELGAAVHAALAAWHAAGPDADLHALYAGPEAGVAMLERYAAHPLARARTLGVELEFNLRLAGARIRGLVDRVCELDGRTILVDYKTNTSLDEKLRDAYSLQLRLYRVAAGRGLLPGGTSPDLVLFDMRRGEAISVTPDDAAVHERVGAAVSKISARDFTLGPQHADRPCVLCAYRPICKDRR